MSQIQITKCDNQLILVGSQLDGSNSYQICDIKSGNGHAVNVSINLVQGAYTKPLQLDGVNGSLNGTYTVAVPTNILNVAMFGVNWGGPTDLALTVSGKSYTYQNSQNKSLALALGDKLDSGQIAPVQIALKPELQPK